MQSKSLTCAAIIAAVLCSGTAFAQEPSDDPFGGGFSIGYKAEVFSMGTQNDSLHSWAFDWLSAEDSLILISDGNLPESYQCGKNRDMAAGDYDGDGTDEVAVAWNRTDGGVFVGIPTINPVTLEPDPAGWHLPDIPIASGVLYAESGLADILGEIRVVAGNFYPDYNAEFVLAYLASDGTVALTMFDIDNLTSIPTQMATVSDQSVNTDLPELQWFGTVSRFDVAAGDFDGDGLDEVALVVNDPMQSPQTDLVLKIYDYDPSAHAFISKPTISFTANSNANHTCLRRVLIETGNFAVDSLDEIAILDHWARTDIDSSRVQTLHTIKLDTAMTGMVTTQMQALPACSWIEEGGVDGSVSAFTTYNGDLIIGGSFSRVGNLVISRIARWDGADWQALGTGINGQVEALAVYEGDLIAGGDFTQAGGVHATNLARWDGSTWEEFAGGTDEGTSSRVKKILPSDYYPGSLYVGGYFSTVGGVSANKIARWDGSAWHALGNGLSGGTGGTAMDMVEHGAYLTVAGAFSVAGSVAANYIAEWYNNTWYAYGSGLNSVATAVVYDNPEKIVGGFFTTAGGGAANRIAYNDGSWHALGSPGLNGPASCLCLDPGPDKDFYVGGDFLTAGSTNVFNIARRDWEGGTWQPLGGGLYYGSEESGSVSALYFYDGELYAGGQFNHAGNIHATGIARWDGSAWHAFIRQQLIPVGLTVGRFNANSELDDIAITTCKRVSDVAALYWAVYGIDTLSAPLTLCEKYSTNLQIPFSFDEGLANSRRLIAIDDVTGNGQADLVVLFLQYNDRKFTVYEPEVDSMNACTFTSVVYLNTWYSNAADITELVPADLDTATVMIAPPMAYHVDSIVQPLAIIYAPPVHYDILDDTTWDVSNRYPLPPDPNYDTYVEYYNSTGFTVTTKTEMHRDWGVSVGLEAWADLGGPDISGYLTTNYGEGFSQQGGYSEQITVGATITAKDDDQLRAVRVSYDILEYPVLRAGETKGHIVVVSPSLTDQGWSPVKMYESLIPNHEVDNILSYPPRGDVLTNPMLASGIIGNASEFYTLQAGSPSMWYLGQQRFTESSVETSWDLTVEAGVSSGYESSFEMYGQSVGMGFEVNLSANYAMGQVSTFSTTFSETDSLHVQFGMINSSGSYSGNRQYEVTPYAYWAKNGALVIDYAVRPVANGLGEDPTWWQIHYSTPDPAFLLPWRLDNEKYDAIDPEENRYQTKEIIFIPSNPAPGDSVLISARVHNFSLSPTSGPVKVSFYLGNPAKGGTILPDKNTGETVFFACDTLGVPIPIAAQGWAIAEMVWQVPAVGSISGCQRIWAQVDPLDEIIPEVHDNGDWATNNLGWKLLFVNAADVCIDTDGDGWADPAFRCNICPHEWDNCPTVYNPDQADSDGDGIGNACEAYVCGNANGDGAVNVGDAVYVINYVFRGGPAPVPLGAGDANCDGKINVGDAVYLVNYIFRGGPAPCCP